MKYYTSSERCNSIHLKFVKLPNQAQDANKRMKFTERQGLSFTAEPPAFIKRMLGNAAGGSADSQRGHLTRERDEGDDEAPQIVGLDAKVSLTEAQGFLAKAHPKASLPQGDSPESLKTIDKSPSPVKTSTVVHIGGPRGPKKRKVPPRISQLDDAEDDQIDKETKTTPVDTQKKKPKKKKAGPLSFDNEP